MKNNSMPNNYGAEAPLSYSEYLRISDLLGLQDDRLSPTHQDELLFMTTHQTNELWFKQILHELDAAILDMAKDHVGQATVKLKRIVAVDKLLVNQVHLLETITPRSFFEFRDKLNPASGFQSLQFKEIEFSSGLKDVKTLDDFRHDDLAYSRLKARYDGPTIGEGFYALLNRRGFDAPHANIGLDLEDRSRLYDRRTSAAVEVLTHFEELYEEFQLAEALMAHDEYFGLWRSHYNKMIQRMVGPNGGVGGSAGIGDQNFFPELWEARTLLQTQHDDVKCPFGVKP